MQAVCDSAVGLVIPRTPMPQGPGRPAALRHLLARQLLPAGVTIGPMRQESRYAGMCALALVVAAGAGNVARPALSQGQARPNIILIQADDLGYGDLSAYGQGKFQTPGIDRLAREGIRFTSYYSGSTVCAPSRAALMTGMHTGHGWIRGNGEIPLRRRRRDRRHAPARCGLSDGGHRQVGPGHGGHHGTAGQEGVRLFLRVSRSPACAPAVHRSPVPQRASACPSISIATT